MRLPHLMKCLLEELISQEAENKIMQTPSLPPTPTATPISDIKSMEMSSESISNNVWVGLFQKLFCSYRTGTFLSENDDSVGGLGTLPKLFWCYRGQACWVPVLEAAFLSSLGPACLDSLYPGCDHAVLFLCLIRVLYTLRMEGWKKLLQSFFRKIWIWRKK